VDLLALVAGQDGEQGSGGVFRIARKTARGRVISAVDTAARHGHKPRHRRFDGYKAHLSVDPDSELIDEVAASAANAPDRDAAAELLGEHAESEDKPEVVGDSGYGDAGTRAGLETSGFTVVAKCPPARNAAGRFPKDRFTVDLGAGTVTCPAGQTTIIVPARGGGGRASFRPWCATCPAAAGLHSIAARARHHHPPPRSGAAARPRRSTQLGPARGPRPPT